ncbi:MAG TPA: hypothetical protein VFG14_01225, partial [Chthoniobacteraceae bacterium]|nr:hypothetical protein [Chthoniobacteraceae bacterium]
MHAPIRSKLLTFGTIIAIAAIGLGAIASEPEPRSVKPQPVELAGLHNAFKIDDQLYSGSSPGDEASFAELARLGVKTVISVDGSKPKLELARKHGLRYVH